MKNILQTIRWELIMMEYRMRKWMFQWHQDEDGDIAFTILRVFHFVKYKENTLFYFNRKYEPAPKYVSLKE